MSTLIAKLVELILASTLGDINPDKIILQVYSGNQSTTLKGANIAADEIHSVNIMLPVIFIIHGWKSTGNATWVQNMTNLLIKKQPSNVITVDWSAYSINSNYPVVTIQVGQIGNLVGDFIVNITRNNSNSLANVHLIGHSLGAHIAGFAGQRVYSKMKAKVARINGLDAAGPWFSNRPPSERLSNDDAIRVDAIHTNGGIFGYSDSYGTSDFFPNGGRDQPGCFTDVCSHSRAYELFTESIVSTNFVAVQCASNGFFNNRICDSSNRTIMGYDQPATASGNYYLSTNANPLYAKGDYFPMAPSANASSN